ncbi:MAG TPA: SelB C-terminal domain-containing protein, partial [Isosphaeraceae bacterium]|nr:SelB C-terminal domain-containing protein [Isosphaeraceae bacterium]
ARAAINLGGVHHTEVHRGHELASPGYLAATRVLSAEVRSSQDAPRPLRHRARYRVHLGTTEVSASLSLLEAEANECRPGSSGLAQLFLAEPVVAVHNQPFVLREESPPATLGGGRVLQPLSRRIRRRDRASLDRLRRLGSQDPLTRLSAALAATGLKPWTERTLCRDTGIALGEVPGALEQLTSSGVVVDLPVGTRRSVRVLAEVALELEDRLLRALARLHAEQPRQSAIGRARVAAALADLGSEALVGGVIERLRIKGQVSAGPRTVSLAGYEPKLSQGERRLKTEIADALRAGGLAPPDSTELAAKAGARAAVVPELLALLAAEEQIVEVASQLYLDIEADAELRRRVSERLADGSRITMAELRDLLGTTRKFAVPIGEYLDRIGLTVREGDTRRLSDQRAPAATPAS